MYYIVTRTVRRKSNRAPYEECSYWLCEASEMTDIFYPLAEFTSEAAANQFVSTFLSRDMESVLHAKPASRTRED